MPPQVLPENEHIIVVAGDWGQFRVWCSARGRAWRDPFLVYASDLQRIMGYPRGTIVVKTGTWQDRPDLMEEVRVRFSNIVEDPY